MFWKSPETKCDTDAEQSNICLFLSLPGTCSGQTVVLEKLNVKCNANTAKTS